MPQTNITETVMVMSMLVLGVLWIVLFPLAALGPNPLASNIKFWIVMAGILIAI
jgi:hypothetical protein